MSAGNGPEPRFVDRWDRDAETCREQAGLARAHAMQLREMASALEEGRLVSARVAGARHSQRLAAAVAVYEAIAARDLEIATLIDARASGRVGPNFVERGKRQPAQLRRYGIREESMPPRPHAHRRGRLMSPDKTMHARRPVS